MSEPRFTCPQCPKTPGFGLTSVGLEYLDLLGVLAHWRWHTEQATQARVRFAVVKEADADHYERMSPAFTLTLIDKQDQLLEIADSLLAVGVNRLGNEIVDAVVAVVVAAGFEQVVTV